MTNVAGLQLSLSDIARLADVQRPVVSMWRRRPLAGHTFPRAVARVSGEERFDAQEVAGYLAATSRGNNPDAGEDLVAYAKLVQLTSLDEIVTVHGLTALLCLAAMTDEPLGNLSTAELHDLARSVDPDDAYLLREIVALGQALRPLAAHVDDLASASYSPSAAFERLLTQRAPTCCPGHAATTLTPAARTLVARIAVALAAHAGAEAPCFVDVTDGSADLLLATSQVYAGQLTPSVATVSLDSPVARLSRRRLRVHDIHRMDVVSDESGDFTRMGSSGDVAVHVLQVPPAGQPGLSDLEVLDFLGNLFVQLSDDSRVVVIGSASALTDRAATAEIDLARDAVIRGDRLRAAIRLPRGLLLRSPRQALALWVLGPAHGSVPVRDRWTAIADISDRSLDESVIDGIVTDVVAAMTPDERSAKSGRAPVVAGGEEAEQVIGHRFRFARRIPTSSLLPGRQSLMDRVPRPRTTGARSASGIELAAIIEQRLAQLGPTSLAGLRVLPADSPSGSSRTGKSETTVAQAMADGHLRAVPGNRLNAEDISAGPDGLVVMGAAEVLGDCDVGSRRIDLVTLADQYPAGRLTEPGDVVACTGPRVGAWVDTAGGSVVQAPARVLRVTEAGRRRFLPSVVAVDVRGAAGRSDGRWRRWPLRILTSDAVDTLRLATAAIDGERQSLLARIAALDDLASTLIDGAASGAIRITDAPATATDPTRPQTHTPEGH